MTLRRRSFCSLAALGMMVGACGGGGNVGVAPGQTPTPSPSASPSATELAAFEADLEQRTFRYFWETSPAQGCLVPDRYPRRTFSSIAASGFALTAYAIGAERGYVTRADAAQRTVECLRFFWNAPQVPGATGATGYKGFFYHFLRYEDGTRFGNTELSTVDTSLLLGGVLFAQSYYTGNNAVETEIRDLADKIYRRVDWQWAQRNTTGTQAANLKDSHGIAMGWKPEQGFESHDWIGYNEGMLVYALAAGSPTYPVGRDAWDQGWAGKLDETWGTYYVQEHLQFESMLGHHYSHVWIDFRGIGDPYIHSKGIDYFENTRRAALSQRGYGAANPGNWEGYDGNVWGWTACDGPIDATYTVNGKARLFHTYTARGVSSHRVEDDGTIAPTTAGGSIPFAPTETLTALWTMKQRYGARLYTEYGFKDAFNPSFTFVGAPVESGTIDAQLGWVSGDYIGIDQGPIVAMIENHRSGLVWNTMRKNPHIRNGLVRLGFTGGWLGN